MKFRDFVELTRDAVGTIAFDLRDEDAIVPMLCLETELGFTVVTADDAFFASSDGTRRLIEGYLVPLIRENHARKLAWVFCAWEAPPGGERPSEHPERREILMATFIDPEVVEHYGASIVREDGLVQVGQWIAAAPNVGGGPAITALQEALR